MRLLLSVSLVCLASNVYAADWNAFPGSEACIPNVIREEAMTAWDFMTVPEGALGVNGFALAQLIRNVVINDMGSIDTILALSFEERNIPAVATGIGRGICVCVRGDNLDYATHVKLSIAGTPYYNVAIDALNSCLNPVPVSFTGGGNGHYGNASPTKIGDRYER